MSNIKIIFVNKNKKENDPLEFNLDINEVSAQKTKTNSTTFKTPDIYDSSNDKKTIQYTKTDNFYTYQEFDLYKGINRDGGKINTIQDIFYHDKSKNLLKFDEEITNFYFDKSSTNNKRMD